MAPDQGSLSGHCWSQLPLEILDLILHRLALPDNFTFRKVCQLWRSVSLDRCRLNGLLPCVVLRPYSASPESRRLHMLHSGQLHKLKSPMLNLNPEERIVGSSAGWLVTFYSPHASITQSRTANYPPSPYLLNPISNERIPLPSLRGRGCLGISQVCLSAVPTSGDCVLVLRDYCDTGSGSYYWCRLGDCKWTSFQVPGYSFSEGKDMLFHEGKLYLLGCMGDFHVYTFDIQPKNISSGSVTNVSEANSWFRQQLVQSEGGLLYLQWGIRGNLTIFRQSEEPDAWVRTECLGDRVLLMGSHTAESFCAKDLIGFGFEGNCIYFQHRLGGNELVKLSLSDITSESIHIPDAQSVEWICLHAGADTKLLGASADYNLPPRPSFWVPPPFDYVKVNFTSQVLDNIATHGIVIRNHLGHVVICKFGRCLTTNATRAKGLALLFGMELAGLVNFSRVVFECDDERLITWLRYDEAKPPRKIHGIIKSCKELSATFDKCAFSYIRKEGNEAALGLALLAQSDHTDVTCFIAPDEISDIIRAELAII